MHTPGPWKIREDGDANHYAIIEDKPEGNWLLSFLHNGESLSHTQKDNAKLIAAAPDLLRELQRMVEYYRHSEARAEAVYKIKAAQQAIAKAIK